EVVDGMFFPRVPQDDSHCSIDLRISATAPLVRNVASIAHASENKTMLDERNLFLVQGQPGYRSDRGGNKKESVGVPQSESRESLGQGHCESDPRKVIVAERRVTDMAGDQDLLFRLTFDEHLPICQMAIG